MIEVKVPDIGDYADVPVIEVLVSPGDTVAPEDALITLESDKATMDVPSPLQGVVQELKVAVGDSVAEGAVILLAAPDSLPISFAISITPLASAPLTTGTTRPFGVSAAKPTL